ncbi:MAG: hypothetical protein DRR19_30925, partial [Candidatus Parabeggiatoa sp. nov. 1]
AGETVYRYDAENQRIGVNQTQYVINSQPALSQVLVKTKADGTQTYYVYGLGLIGQEQAGSYLAYHFDFRGSTVALTDETGIVTEQFQYSPYGVLVDGEVDTTPFLFNGMYGVMSDGNGLYYMRARYYHPEIRRFVNQDVLLGRVAEGQTLNRYAFVTGKPVSFVDPFGLSGKDVYDGFMTGFFGFVIGAGVAAVAVATLPISATGMAVIGVTSAAVGGFFVGVTGYEYFTEEDYWSGEKLSPSEVDNRLGHLIVDGITLGAGCTWFRIRSRDPKALSDWEWLKLSPKERQAYDDGLGTVPDDFYNRIGKLLPQDRGIKIRDTDWINAIKNAKTGPGPGGRFSWPLGLAGSEVCDDCLMW